MARPTSIFDPMEMRFDGRVVVLNPLSFENPRVKGPTTHLRPGYGALILVGLSVGGRPKYSAEDIRDFVIRERRAILAEHLAAVRAEGNDAPGHGGSIIPQLGYWDIMAKDGGFEPSTENSVGVRIFNFPAPVSRNEFVEDMEELGNRLAVHFQQDYVYVLIDKGGIVEENIQITSNEA